MYVDVSQPAKELLRRGEADVFSEVARSTHVAGASEGEAEAALGAQPGGVLNRSSFRRGHAGQVMRACMHAAQGACHAIHA